MRFLKALTRYKLLKSSQSIEVLQQNYTVAQIEQLEKIVAEILAVSTENTDKETLKKMLLNKAKAANIEVVPSELESLYAILAKKALENFNGKDIGFITRDSRKSVDGLSETEFLSFAMKLFESQNKKGYVMLDGKAVVYTILEQELLNSDKLKEYNSLLIQNMGAIKNGQLQQDLLDTLQKRYDIELYYRR